MKNTIFLSLLLLTCISASSQGVRISEMTTLPTSPTGGYLPMVKNGQNYKVPAEMLGNAKLDSVALRSAYRKVSDVIFPYDTMRFFAMDGAVYKKMITGVWKFSDFGIYPNASNNYNLIQAALNRSYVTELQANDDTTSAYRYTGKLIGNDKTMSFVNGSYLLGTGANDSLDAAILKGDMRSKIFQNIRLSKTVRSALGFFPWMWNGMHPDSSSDANMAKVHRWTDFSEAKSQNGVTILINSGIWNLKRYGPDQKMMEPGSYSVWMGESKYTTTLLLDSTARSRFARFFYITSGKAYIDIKGLSFNGQNHIANYANVGDSLGGDAQGAFVMTYADSLNPARHISVSDCIMENPIGDQINISRNTFGVDLFDILIGGHLRQGISFGGGNVWDLTIKNIRDIKGKTYKAKPGGNSIHCEPYAAQYNIKIYDCNILDLSVANIIGLTIDNVTTTTTTYPFLLNFVADVSVTNCKIAGDFQCTPGQMGGVSFLYNNIKGQFDITAVSGYSTFPKKYGMDIMFNHVYQGMTINIVDSVNVAYNHIYKKGGAPLVFSNQASGRAVGNELVNDSAGNYALLYAYSTLTSGHGKGMIYIAGNYGRGYYRAIQLSNKSAIIGPDNDFDAPSFVVLQNNSKLFPYKDGAGRRILNCTAIPTWGEWTEGDIISIKDGDIGNISEYTVRTTGILNEGYWLTGNTYYNNVYVIDTGRVGGVLTTRYYKSVNTGGGAERPFDDTDNTYWLQVGTAQAVLMSTKVNDIKTIVDSKYTTGTTQTHTSGTSVTISATAKRLFVDPASALASLTITLPSAPADGDIVNIMFGGTMSSGATVSGSMTVSPGGSNSLKNGIGLSSEAGTAMTFIYKLANTTWYRIANP